MIQEGDTIGVFQIESRAQIQMLPRTRPENLDDLAVQVAIVRPGPIVGGAVNPYVRRRELQRRNPRYRPPTTIPFGKALADTLGVIFYQDQVIQVCQAMAGFSAGQADGSAPGHEPPARGNGDGELLARFPGRGPGPGRCRGDGPQSV